MQNKNLNHFFDPKKLWPKIEEDILDFWNGEKIFEESLSQTQGSKPYIFYDGPPFATGLPHYGHILGSTAKDMIGRFWTMRGYFVARRWGWDCHGLPIENIVEEKLHINSKKEIEVLGIDRFNEECRSQVFLYTNEWGKTIRRIARWVDFENSYKTLDASFMESVWWGFKKMWEKGYVYEGKKVLLCCPRCETPIAKAEVAMDNSYKDVTENSVYVKFLLKTQNKKIKTLDENCPTYLLAWTTTPWTLPGNVALAVGKNIIYVAIKQNDEIFILAKERLNILQGEYKICSEFKGQDLLGLKYVPLYEISEIQEGSGPVHEVVIGDFVTTSEGTGIVHTAVMYGEDDFELGLKLNLPLVPLLSEKAIFKAPSPKFLVGKYFKDADALILEDFSVRGLAYAVESNTHSYPHCFRCETPLFYNAINAWFVDIQKIKPKLLELNKKLNWHPEHFRDGRFKKSVEGAPDWNISRNRYWGTPMPIWKCENCSGIKVVGSIKELPESYHTLSDLHRPKIDEVIFSCECGGVMKRVLEVFDCWLESASMPFASVHYPFENVQWFAKNFPAQFIAEYTGQVRTWFYYMLAVSAVLFDSVPFENIVVTGVILTENGSKMSKSKKNFPDPWMIFDRYGVDALRYYLMSDSIMDAEDLNFREKSLDEIYKKYILTLKNVVDFYLLFKGDDTQKKNSQKNLHILDQWILVKLKELQCEVSNRMESYEIVKAVRPIMDFVQELSTWYIRRSRDRFKKRDEAALLVLREVLEELAKIVAPFTPFMGEFVYRMVNGQKKSVHLETWPKASPLSLAEKQILLKMEHIKKIASVGLMIRAKENIKVRQPLALCEISDASGLISSKDMNYIHLLKEELNVLLVKIHQAEENQFSVVLDTNFQNNTLLLELGLKRELIRHVNALRKEMGLTVGDHISFSYWAEDLLLLSTLQKFEKEILEETLSENVTISKEILGQTDETLLSGRSIRLLIKKI